jgi:hypothetical protein
VSLWDVGGKRRLASALVSAIIIEILTHPSAGHLGLPKVGPEPMPWTGPCLSSLPPHPPPEGLHVAS